MNRVREVRLSKGLTGFALAIMVPMTPSDLSRMERRLRPAWPKHRARLAEILETSEDYLFPEADQVVKIVKDDRWKKFKAISEDLLPTATKVGEELGYYGYESGDAMFKVAVELQWRERTGAEMVRLPPMIPKASIRDLVACLMAIEREG
jgi:transcriptional regulator with XRE-family HTH domain